MSLRRQAMLRSAGGDEPAQLHTPRRSATAHYGVPRHTLRYLLRCHGLDAADCRRVSLLLRAQMLSLAGHDLRFVREVSVAERSVLNIACRSLAYSDRCLPDLDRVAPSDLSTEPFGHNWTAKGHPLE